MIFRLVFFVLIVLTDLQRLALFALQLTATSTVWENSNLTLYCDNGGAQLESVLWILIEPEMTEKRASVAFSSNSCIRGSSEWFISTVYTTSCHDGGRFSITIKRVERSMHGDTWMCAINQGNTKSNEIKIAVQVPVVSVTIGSTNDTLTLVENHIFILSCTTSECLPKPSIAFEIEPLRAAIERSSTPASNVIKSYISEFQITPDRTWNGHNMSCTASNKNAEVVSSKAVRLNIRYLPKGPPVIRNHPPGSEIRVIRNRYLNLTCSVTGGNPLPHLKWNKNNTQAEVITGESVTKSVLWLVLGTDQENVTCQYMHPIRTEETYVTVDVLYPPREPTILIKDHNTGDFMQVPSSTVKVIEHLPFTLKCSADANPSVETFLWKGIPDLMTNTTEIYTQNIKRNMSGMLTCIVQNTMTPSDVISPESGTNQTSVNVDVLYPPVVKALANTTLIEGENLRYICAIQSGNPATTVITWKDPAGKIISRTEMDLKVYNISRNDAGIYTCIAQNFMNSADGFVQNGTGSGKLTVDVEYAADVLQMIVDKQLASNVTVNENESVKFMCKVEGNPAPTAKIILSSPMYGSNKQNEELVIKTQTDGTFVAEFVASCYDAGEYTCIGSNTFYTGESRNSTKAATININCEPRMSKIHNVSRKVYTSINKPVTLTFTAVAYPVPAPSGYTWSRQTKDGNWTYITTESSFLYSVSTQGLQSSLTLTNVTKSDHGLYNLTISNNIGTFTFTFFLHPSEKPSAPVGYGIFKETVTDSSVTVWWEPEFDGGVPQRFIISYRISSSDSWLNFSSIPEETTNRMTKTLGNLLGGSKYHVLIYAENKFGSVRIGREIVFKTKDFETNERNVGAAAGGGVGAVVILTAVVIIAIIYKRKRAGTFASDDINKDCVFNNQNSYELNASTMYQTLQLPYTDAGVQYQQLSAVEAKGHGYMETGQQKVYENLRITNFDKRQNMEQ